MGCKVSIIGSCIPRDCLGVHEGDGGYSVERYVQAVNPVSAVSNTMLLKEFDWDNQFINTDLKIPNDFYKKMLKLDLTKQMFTYMSEVRSDYLLIDAAEVRLRLLYDNKGGYFTNRFPKATEELIKRDYLPSNAVPIELSAIDDNEFDWYMDRYVESIKNIYDEDSIILFECMCIPYSLNKDRTQITLNDYKQVTKYNQSMQRGYKALIERLPYIHIVEFPHGVLGDDGNKWGRYPLHYIPEYYDYGLEALNIITELHLPVAEEQFFLSELKKSYELKIKQIYEPICVKSIQTYRQRDNLCSRMEAYEAYMKDLLMDKNKIDKIKNFFIENHFESCAFYGLTELSKLFIPFFKQWGIHIDYVIEEIGQKEYEGIKIIKKSAPFYPDIPVMIITEVIYKDQVKEKLASRDVAYPYYDVYDILN